jgi:hypothetical protein
MRALIIVSLVMSATASFACNKQSFNQEVTLHSKTCAKQDVQVKKPADKKNNLDRQSKRG